MCEKKKKIVDNKKKEWLALHVFLRVGVQTLHIIYHNKIALKKHSLFPQH